jgi:hypothetical protein
MLYAYRPGEVYTGFWWGNWREKDRLEDLGAEWKTILQFNFQK